MRERILFAPGIRGGELLKSLAMHGVNCINLRIMSAGELAGYALMRSGISIKEDLVSAKEEVAFIAKAISGIGYFGNTTYSDLQHITGAVRQMRCMVDDDGEEECLKDKLSGGIFSDKNRALFDTYRNYMRLLRENDSADSVSVIRRAIASAKPLDAEFIILKEYPLNPLETRLLNKLSDGRYTVTDVGCLYRLEKKKPVVESFKNCYGASNEVETILNDIYAEKELDRCTVAVTDSATYAQIFFDYALLHNIPMTFGCGVPIMNSNPAGLLLQYYHWITDGFFGREALDGMLNSKAFDRHVWREQFPKAEEGFHWSTFYEVLGGLRLTNDGEINKKRIEGYKKALDEESKIVRESDRRAYGSLCRRKQCVPYLEIAARELSLEIEEFIKKYSCIRKGKGTYAERLLMMVDKSAVGAIYEEFQVIKRTGAVRSTDDLIQAALKISVCGEPSEEGKLHITDIGGAVTSIRDNLYLAGMSASMYPGSPTEDYLLLDDDIRLFGEHTTYLTSQGRIEQKKTQFHSLTKLAAGLGSKLYVSYAGLNVSDLKKDNASSLIFELYREESGMDATTEELEKRITKVDYFAPSISATREIGKAYNAGKKIVGNASVSSEAEQINVLLDKEWSPSAINKLFTDPRAFMLEYLMGIPQADEVNLFEIMSPLAAGNLSHDLMERLANTELSRDEFVKMAEEYFDRYLLMNPPLLSKNTAEAKMDFLEMMENAYDGDPHREVVLKEEDIHCVHESGVKIHGLPDRVEKLPDGTYVVVDFKSGRTVRHLQDDIETCLQIVIYSYLLEQQGYSIARGEFRYLRSGEVITCKYDDDMKQKLNDRLCEFKRCIEDFQFHTNEAEDDEEGDDYDE